MALALSDLLSGQTTDETLSTLVALAAVAGFPAYSWQSGTVPRTFFELEALAYADLTQVIGAIAGGGFVDYAEGPWLTLRAAQGYNITRKAAVYTRGTITLTDAGGIGPYDITTDSQVVVQSGDTRYRVVSATGYVLPLTLPASGSVTLTFEAEVPGIGGNLPEGSTFEMVTSLPGVTVAQETPPGGSWITTQGSNEETDAELRIRCKARWGELGYGSTEAAYKFWALSASDEVTRVALSEPDGYGGLVVYVAGASGAISSGALSAVTSAVQLRRPMCVTPTVTNATQVTIALAGTVKVNNAAIIDAAKAAANTALATYFSTIPIGGTVYRAPIEAVILNAYPGILNVILTNDPETALLASQVPVVSVAGLSWGT